MAGGGGCRDKRCGSSASKVGTVDGTAKNKKTKTKTSVQYITDLILHVLVIWAQPVFSALGDSASVWRPSRTSLPEGRGEREQVYIQQRFNPLCVCPVNLTRPGFFPRSLEPCTDRLYTYKSL